AAQERGLQVRTGDRSATCSLSSANESVRRYARSVPCNCQANCRCRRLRVLTGGTCIDMLVLRAPRGVSTLPEQSTREDQNPTVHLDPFASRNVAGLRRLTG